MADQIVVRLYPLTRQEGKLVDRLASRLKYKEGVRVFVHRESIGRRISRMAYALAARVQSENEDDRNIGGLVILLKDSEYGTEKEVIRVAFERSNSANPDVPFDVMVDRGLSAANKSLKVIQELDGELKRMTEKAGDLQ